MWYGLKRSGLKNNGAYMVFFLTESTEYGDGGEMGEAKEKAKMTSIGLFWAQPRTELIADPQNIKICGRANSMVAAIHLKGTCIST